MNIKKLVVPAVCSLILGGGALAVTAQPAAATSTRICNSSDSTDLHRIRVYDSVPGGWYYYVSHGNCSPYVDITGALVNTCPDGNSISYYVIKNPGGSYGTHHNGCNPDSNPTNVSGNIYYKMMN